MKRRLETGLAVLALLMAVVGGTTSTSAQQRTLPLGRVVTGPTVGGLVIPGFGQPVVTTVPPVVVVTPTAPFSVLGGPIHFPAATCWDLLVNGVWTPSGFVPPHVERFCQ